MRTQREVAEAVWPEHTELLSDHDWAVLAASIASNRAPDESIVEPRGEAKDRFLTTLLIVYWTMKIVDLAVQIAKETRDLKGRERAAAILHGVSSRLDDATPKLVAGKVEEIIDHMGL